MQDLDEGQSAARHALRDAAAAGQSDVWEPKRTGMLLGLCRYMWHDGNLKFASPKLHANIAILVEALQSAISCVPAQHGHVHNANVGAE